MAVEQIGIFSDIHGNAVAFEAVLAALRAEGVERFVCLGDVAATGPQPREVIQRLRDLGCPVVMGNTDDHLLAPIEPESGDEDLIRIRELDHWGAEQLTSDERAFLASFAPTVTLPLANGGSLLCYHGTPRSFNDLLLPTTPTDEVNEALDGVTATVLAGGHTHQQMLRRHRDMLILNPGSVGLPVDRVPFSTQARNPPWAEFAVLTSGDDGSIGIALRRVPFDVAAHLAAVRASGMPHAEWYASDWITG
jgi:predicted phosphodiesterase